MASVYIKPSNGKNVRHEINNNSFLSALVSWALLSGAMAWSLSVALYSSGNFGENFLFHFVILVLCAEGGVLAYKKSERYFLGGASGLMVGLAITAFLMILMIWILGKYGI